MISTYACHVPKHATYNTLSTISHLLSAAGTLQGSAAAPAWGYEPLRMSWTQLSVKPASVSLLMLRPELVHLSLVSPAMMTGFPLELELTQARIWSMPAERASISPLSELNDPKVSTGTAPSISRRRTRHQRGGCIGQLRYHRWSSAYR